MNPSNLVLIAALWSGLAVPGLAWADTDATPVSMDAATLDGLPRQDARMNIHGHVLDCTGVSLVDLLRKAGAMPATPLRGPQLARLVDVQAADGYRVVFSLGELEPGLGKTQVILADQCQGKPLAAQDGPLRLLVPGDSRPARSVRQVDRITVRSP